MENKKDPKEQREIDPKSFLRETNGLPVDHEFLASLRKSLMLHMQTNPPLEAVESVRASNFFALAPAFAILILILVAGGTSFASQNSLPGNWLYPVKILSEKISVATSLSPETRSKARLLIAETRVNEVSALVHNNTIEPAGNDEQFHAAMQTVIKNFNAQVSTTLAEEQNLAEKNDPAGAARIADAIRAATDSYKNILENARQDGGERTKDDLNQFINSNEDFNTRASQSRRRDDEKSSSKKETEHTSDNHGNHGDNESDKRGSTNKKNESPAPPTLNFAPQILAPSANIIIPTINNLLPDTRPETLNNDEQKKPDSGDNSPESGKNSDKSGDSHSDGGKGKNGDKKD